MRSGIRSIVVSTCFALVSLGGVATASSVKRLPHGVPIPSGSKILATKSGGHGDAYVVSVTNETSAYAYWLKALPAAGFAVNKKESSSHSGQGQIWFSGHGLKPAGTLINIYKQKAVVNLETS